MCMAILCYSKISSCVSGLLTMRLPTQLCSIFIGYLHPHCLQPEVVRPKRFPLDMTTNRIMLGIKPSMIRTNLDP